jgi:hypothetical protein
MTAEEVLTQFIKDGMIYKDAQTRADENGIIQKEASLTQYKRECRREALRVAKYIMPIDVTTKAEEIYQWLIKE